MYFIKFFPSFWAWVWASQGTASEHANIFLCSKDAEYITLR